jgi:hypothetical protein
MSESNTQLGMKHFDVTITTDVVGDHSKIFADSTCAKAFAPRYLGIQKVSDFDPDKVTRLH